MPIISPMYSKSKYLSDLIGQEMLTISPMDAKKEPELLARGGEASYKSYGYQIST